MVARKKRRRARMLPRDRVRTSSPVRGRVRGRPGGDGGGLQLSETRVDGRRGGIAGRATMSGIHTPHLLFAAGAPWRPRTFDQPEKYSASTHGVSNDCATIVLPNSTYRRQS